jgi:sugar-specific transcriptional regulator TrmB
MHQKILTDMGLSPNEAKIYLSLLELKSSGVGVISSHSGIHRRNVYDTIIRLIKKGLIFPVLKKGENQYSPVEPNKLLEVLREKELELSKILPELERQYQERTNPQEAYIYKGIEGFKNYLKDILKENQDVYFIGAKLGWLDPRINTYLTNFLKQAKEKKIKFHHLFDNEVKEKTDSKELSLLGTDFKFIPKEFSTFSAADIFGDYVVTFTGLNYKQIDEDVTLFVLRDKDLAESYRTWWKFMYKHCIKSK